MSSFLCRCSFCITIMGQPPRTVMVQAWHAEIETDELGLTRRMQQAHTHLHTCVTQKNEHRGMYTYTRGARSDILAQGILVAQGENDVENAEPPVELW